jgi:DNA-binding winged helix-turn-helix (wHTH) protein
VEESNLAQNVSPLRKAMCELPGELRYMATVPRKGYRFVGEVRISEHEASSTGEKKDTAARRRGDGCSALPWRGLVLVAA